MDPDQFAKLLEHQTKLFGQLMTGIQRSIPAPAPAGQSLGANISVPQPAPLALEGDMERNFEFFEKSWTSYTKAVGMDRWPGVDNAQKVSFLLSMIGEPARKKYFNFELTAEEQATVAAALTAIKQKVIAKRNIIIDRLDFFSASQLTGETIDDYTTRLKVLAQSAKLGTLETELITYKVVTANKWSQLRTKMLTVTDITLSKAVDMCRAEEIAAKRSVELAIPASTEVKKITKPKKRAPTCKFCGQQHEFTKGSCPALGQRCRRCNGKNHFEGVCKKPRKSSSKKSKKVKEVKEETSSSESEVESSTSSESEECEIGKIYDDSDIGGSVSASLTLKFGKKWKAVKCELDTGASTSLIGRECLLKLDKEEKTPLLPSKYKLQSFGGNPIKVLGQVKVSCRREGKKYKLVLQVVEGDHFPLLSAKVCRILGFVKFCKTVSFRATETEDTSRKLLNIYRVKAQKIVEAHSDIFTGYGKLAGEVSLEVDPNVAPSIQPPRRVPIAMRGKLKKELETLEKAGLIVKEFKHTDWVSNIVLVQRGGPESPSIRICLDPIPLNKALKRPNLQFVTLDEILPELGEAKVFSTVDAKKGFWHVVLDEASSKLTTFWTPFGRYRWIRLPFGIAPAPEIFQMRLQEVIQGLKGVECIADDLLVYGIGNSFEEALIDHNRCLETLLTRLEEHNVKLNKSKLKLCQTSVKFYGHVLTDQGIKPDESKIATIQNFPTPTNRKEVHRFIGMVNYLSRFLRNLSANLTNLRKLILESVPWQWTTVEEEEFGRVKALVADVSTLRYYNVNLPLTIECDASCFGLGAVVYQSDGVLGYASRTLTPTERNYAQIEKELLAILFACTRFDQLIVGNPKTVIKTDHKPLISLFEKPLLSAPRRLQHMLLNLQRYRLSLEFVTGKENVVADALSRAPLDVQTPGELFEKRAIYRISEDIEALQLSKFLRVSDNRLEEIKAEIEKDQSMQLIIGYIQHGWPATADRVPNSMKIYFSYRDELSMQDGMVFRGDRLVIPHVLRRKLVDSCHAEYHGSKRKFLVTVDEPDILKDFTPESVIKVCKPNFTRHGKRVLSDNATMRQRVLSDNATKFSNVKMARFATEWDFELVTSASHHQQANGKPEAAVKTANLLPRVVENVSEAIEKNRKSFKQNYNKRTRQLPDLQIGSPVYAQLHPESSKQWSAGTIADRLSERSYLVNVGGANYRRSLDHLKPRKESNTSPDRSQPSSVPESAATPSSTSTIEPTLPHQGKNTIYCQKENSAGSQFATMEPQTVASPVRQSPARTSSAASRVRATPTPVARAPTATQPQKEVPADNSRPKRDIRMPARFNDYHVTFE